MKGESFEVTKDLATFITDTKLEKIPLPVQEKAIQAILDCLGVTLAGSKSPAGKIITDFIKSEGGKAQVSVFGKRFKTTAQLAALANGTFGHALDYDDINRTMRGHPTVPVLPATFAVGEEEKASGKEILQAFIIGVEVETKLGAGLNPYLFEGGWHPTAVLGTMGATAAVSKILKLPAEKVCLALGIAASLASGVRQNFGTMTKPLHAGQAARNGVMAAKLAQKGFTADKGIIEGKLGYARVFAGEGRYDLLKIVGQLGAPFDLISPGLGFKRYPSCARTHPAIEAMLEMVAKHNLQPEEVESITCWGTYTTPEMLIHSRPKTALEGKFSLEFCVALALWERRVELGQFRDEKVREPHIQETIKKVSFFVRPDLNNIENSGNPSTTVKIRFKDGREISQTVDEARGTPGHPLSQEELKEKFRQCGKGILSKEEIEKTMALIENLEGLKRIATLTDLLRGGR